ncbi:cobalt transport protein CbiN [Striga asiatica]|uniref:Cobalt transport protein CbiN n=1 Tax=Striga asiatica TaxID=4170 RepID=A0A5A7Q4D0_STRAF|nr:cobalt transport protein CbiN [Striga asiatica]
MDFLGLVLVLLALETEHSPWLPPLFSLISGVVERRLYQLSDQVNSAPTTTAPITPFNLATNSTGFPKDGLVVVGVDGVAGIPNLHMVAVDTLAVLVELSQMSRLQIP